MRTGICSICGRAAVLFICQLCGRPICQKCMIDGVCVECRRGRRIKKEIRKDIRK